jgi:glycosyltransferase involved in cell wall biosynthesis
VKLALVGPVYPYRGGIAHYNTLLVQALRQDGHEVLPVSFSRQYPKWLYPGKSDRDPSQKAMQIDAEFILDPLSPLSWRRTWHRIRAFAPQQVVFNWWTTFWGPAFANLAGRLRKEGLPVTFLIHNVMPHESKAWDRWLALWTLRTGSAFIVQTERERQRLLGLLPRAQVALTPHPIYDMFAAQRLEPSAAREKLGLPAAGKVLLFFGIVRRYKGLSILLQALAQPELSSVKPILLVAGEFWEDKSSYLEQVQAMGLSEQVKFEDRYIPNEEVALFFSAADLLAAPYTGGTQSGAVKMAMGFGLPAVVSQHLADDMILTRAGESVFLADAGDANSLAHAIAQALRAPKTLPSKPAAGNGWSSMVKTLEQCV